MPTGIRSPEMDLSPQARDELVSQIVTYKRVRVPNVEIAQNLGLTNDQVARLYRQALAAHPLTYMAIDEHRAEEVDLIDAAIRELMCIAYDPKMSARSRIDAWLAMERWAERKSKLLGLDAPTKHEITTIGQIEVEIQRLEAELNAPIRAELTRGDSAGAAAAAGGAEGTEGS